MTAGMKVLLVTLGMTFGALLMIVDELFVSAAVNGWHYDTPVLGVLNVWVAWQIVFAALIMVYLLTVVTAGKGDSK